MFDGRLYTASRQTMQQKKEKKTMTDNDIREYIEELEEPIFLKDVVSELTSKDPTISWKRVTRLMREMGFENRLCKNALNPRGKGSVWTRVNAFATSCEDDEVDEDDCVDDEDDENDDEVDEDVDEVDENDVYDAEKTEDTEDTKAKRRSAADALHDVEEQNAVNAELSAKLFESLNRSRSLKEELMQRQRDALIELARRILGLYGSEKERKTYGDF